MEACLLYPFPLWGKGVCKLVEMNVPFETSRVPQIFLAEAPPSTALPRNRGWNVVDSRLLPLNVFFWERNGRFFSVAGHFVHLLMGVATAPPQFRGWPSGLFFIFYIGRFAFCLLDDFLGEGHR